jgi:hypothetical protein
VPRGQLQCVEQRLIDEVEAEAEARGYSRAAMASVIVELGLRALRDVYGNQEGMAVMTP